MLTQVELLWFEGRIERWIRFGRPAAERILDRRRRVLSFAPGETVALVRWRANDYGTAVSRIDILRAARPGQALTVVPFVTPGGELLLRVEQLGVDPADAAFDHWRHVHNRLATGETPRPYTRERHRAWLLRRRDEP